jgi:hypothetical protein
VVYCAWEIIDINKKEQRSKYWSLGNSCFHFVPFRVISNRAICSSYHSLISLILSHTITQQSRHYCFYCFSLDILCPFSGTLCTFSSVLIVRLPHNVLGSVSVCSQLQCVLYIKQLFADSLFLSLTKHTVQSSSVCCYPALYQQVLANIWIGTRGNGRENQYMTDLELIF